MFQEWTSTLYVKCVSDTVLTCNLPSNVWLCACIYWYFLKMTGCVLVKLLKNSFTCYCPIDFWCAFETLIYLQVYWPHVHKPKSNFDWELNTIQYRWEILPFGEGRYILSATEINAPKIYSSLPECWFYGDILTHRQNVYVLTIGDSSFSLDNFIFLKHLVNYWNKHKYINSSFLKQALQFIAFNWIYVILYR